MSTKTDSAKGAFVVNKEDFATALQKYLSDKEGDQQALLKDLESKMKQMGVKMPPMPQMKMPSFAPSVKHEHEGHWKNMFIPIYQSQLEKGRISEDLPFAMDAKSWIEIVDIRSLSDEDTDNTLKFINNYNHFTVSKELFVYTREHGLGLVCKQKSGDHKVLGAILALNHSVETKFKFQDKLFANTYVFLLHPAFRNMELGITLAQNLTVHGYIQNVFSGYQVSSKVFTLVRAPLQHWVRPIDIRKVLRCGIKFQSMKKEKDKDNRRDVVHYKVDSVKTEPRRASGKDLKVLKKSCTEASFIYKPTQAEWSYYVGKDSPFKTYVFGKDSVFSLYHHQRKFKNGKSEVVANVAQIVLFAGVSTARPDTMRALLSVCEREGAEMVYAVETGHMYRDFLESCKFIKLPDNLNFSCYNYSGQLQQDDPIVPILC